MRRFALLGRKLSHSYSKIIHENFGGEYSYDLVEVEPEKLRDVFFSGYDGFNVTIPYKQDVIPFCDEISEEAREVGAVNTVVFKDGRAHGYNTDVYGLTKTVEHTGVSVAGIKALVLGSGGSAKTATYVLAKMGAREAVVISRGGPDNYDNISKHADAEVIINTTPVGMYPNFDARPVDLRAFPRLKLVVDIIYNPLRTRLLQQAEELKIPHCDGLLMLVLQAARASELFTGRLPEAGNVTEEIRKSMQNTVLIGMPGCGKTSYAKRLAKNYVDTDDEITAEYGLTPRQIIETEGEPAFRRKEREVVKRIALLKGRVIATGGGVILNLDNVADLKANGRLVYLRRGVEKLATRDRPLSKNLKEMYEIRGPLYEKYADEIKDKYFAEEIAK